MFDQTLTIQTAGETEPELPTCFRFPQCGVALIRQCPARLILMVMAIIDGLYDYIP